MEEIVLALLFSLITSFVSIVLLIFLTRVKRFNRNRLVIPYLKIVIILHAIPFVYIGIRLARLHSMNNFLAYTSMFGLYRITKESGLIIVCSVLLGFLVAVIIRLVQCCRLKSMLKGNVPIENNRTMEIFFEYKEKYGVKHARIMQNDLVDTAITSGIFTPTIILPYDKCQGSDKELRMVLAHEFNHIKSHDVLWKYIALIVSTVYWYSPLSYLILSQLDCEQEVECDISTCSNETAFTTDEYFAYLEGIDVKDLQKHFASAFCMTKYDIHKRMEITKMKKNIKKPSKIIVFMMAVLVSVMSAVPVYAAVDAIVDGYDKQLWSEGYADQINVDESGEYVEQTAYLDNDGVTEINMGAGATLLSSLIDIEDPIPATTRLIFGTQNMVVGDSVAFSLSAGNASDVFHVGVRNNDSFIYRWLEVTGSVLYQFKIEEDANYSAFIYNPNSAVIYLDGFIVYDN